MRSYLHKYGDAAGKLEIRDEIHQIRGCKKTNISYEIAFNFDIFDALLNRLAC